MNETSSAALLNDRRSQFLFWGFATLLLFAGLGETAFWGSEGRWAEVSRNILLSGDWFHPAINGEIYFDKPLVSYWLIAIPAALTGILNEFVVRLPSTMAGLAGLWGTFLLADKLWNRRTAIISCWVLLTSYGFVFWARKGAADMENLAAIILAVAWYFHWHDKTGFWSYLLFGLICVVGAHAKGLPALCVPVVAVIPALVRHQNWKKHLKWQVYLAVFISIIIYFIPYILAAVTKLPAGWHCPDTFDGLEMPGWAESYRRQLCGPYLVWKENVLRAFEPFDHKQPFYAYIIHVPRIMLPWTPLFLIALAAFISKWKKLEERDRWLVEAIALIFLLFSISGSKRWYYILPIMPFCAVLTAVFITGDWWQKAQTWLWLFYKYVILAAGGALTLAIPLQYAVKFLFQLMAGSEWKLMNRLLVFRNVSFPLPWLAVLTLLGIIVLALWIHYYLRPEQYDWIFGARIRRWTPLLLSCWVLFFAIFCIAPDMLEKYRTKKGFSNNLKTYRNHAGINPENIAFYNRDSPTVIFYMGFERSVPVIRTGEELNSFLASPGKEKLIISERRYVAQLKVDMERPLPSPVLNERVLPWEKPNKKIVVYRISKQETGLCLTLKNQ